MCLGPELLLPMLIGGAISGGGALIKQNGENAQAEQSAKSRNKVLTDTLAKNDKIAQQTRESYAAREAGYAPTAVAARQGDAETSRMAGVDAILPQTAPDPTTATAADSPDIVKTEVAARMSDALKRGRDQAKATAKLGSYGDQWFGQNIDNTAASRDIALQSGFANSNLQNMPGLQDLADLSTYKPVSPLGSIMMGVGNAVGSAGGAGYFRPGV